MICGRGACINQNSSSTSSLVTGNDAACRAGPPLTGRHNPTGNLCAKDLTASVRSTGAKPVSDTAITSTEILPPHDKPTSQAVASATPKSSRWLPPVLIISRAASITAPSTQPPDTEPAICESSRTSIKEPTCRGDDPHV